MKILIFLAMATITDDHIMPLWETVDKKIITESVCYNYEKGSIDNWLCRKKAVRQFKTECNKKKNKEKKKFCEAARKTRVAR